ADHEAQCGGNAIDIDAEIGGALTIHLHLKFRLIQTYVDVGIYQAVIRGMLSQRFRIPVKLFEVRPAKIEKDIRGRTAAEVYGLHVANADAQVAVFPDATADLGHDRLL